MSTSNESKRPLKEFFHIDEIFYDKTVFCLREVFLESDYKPLVVRIMNQLIRHGYKTIGDVLNATSEDILKIRCIGTGSEAILHSLLERIIANPQLIVNCESVTPDPEVLKSERKEAIKAQLRKMGMIV